ncbi:DUF983 domain-containing protein [Phreatobacter oligotrophus]|jgi:uncharacterized protein (DUF983 family)|uniref:DUF983 domain-containing protein n=1 Tax=Phreatobacter oligotrophus TaxID=1122261 RepID=UPI0023543000|nr:DUF983 domain-containing protein [Phreatobacter oligotrophus]MBX9991698.1 DUF983 domain-containing protein [Phreatobacter oligotrophus]
MTYYQEQSPVSTGLKGRCPRCGEGHLFDGFLSVKPKCSACGLDFAFADSGDGPAVFVILLAGFLICGAALVVEVKYTPPFWVHALIFGPMVLIVCLGLLRPMKGLMIALQYRNNAREGRLDSGDA